MLCEVSLAAYEIWHTWSRRSGMGLDRQLFLFRRGGATGPCGCDVIFGGNGGFTLPRSTRFTSGDILDGNISSGV